MNRLILSNLKEGMIIKNYIELCAILNIPTTNGNSKKAQLNELRRFCEYEIIGHKFYIKKIFETAKEKKDGRLHYKQYAEFLILNHLCESYRKNGEYQSTLSKSEWCRVIGANCSMMYNRKEILKYLNSGFSLPNLSLNSIHGLFNMIYSKLNDIFITAIDGLSKDKVISIDKNLYIDKADKGYVIAENEEINKYERLSAELILEMGYSDIYSLMADYNRYLKYKNNLKKSYSNLYGWKNAHYRYCITGLNTSYIEKHFLDDKVSMQEKLYNEVKLFVEERIKKAVEKGKSHYWSVIDNCLETDAELRFDFMLDEWVADDMVFFLYNVA